MVSAFIDAARMWCKDTRWLRSSLLGSTVAPVTSDYTTGTVTVTNGSATVTGAGTTWNTAISTGVNQIQPPDVFIGPNGVSYEVLSVASNTSLVLTAPYAGTTLAAQPYKIQRARYHDAINLGSDTFSEIAGISGISIRSTNGEWRPMTEQASNLWDANLDAGQPEVYQFNPMAQFAVHPKPDAAYDLTVGLVLMPARGSNQIDEALVQRWEYAFRAGALGYLLDLPGTKYRDQAESKRQWRAFELSVYDGIAAAGSSYNAGALPSGSNGPRTARIRTGRQAI
jgi:hypothetical protein